MKSLSQNPTPFNDKSTEGTHLNIIQVISIVNMMLNAEIFKEFPLKLGRRQDL